MKSIKILGTGCSKCKSTYSNVLKALKETGTEADIEKIEDIEKIMEYNIMSTPALIIDGEIKVKGRVAEVNEIKELLLV